MVGKSCLESSLKLPVHLELASEFRYGNPFINSGTLVIAMTQSGETADTLASVKMAKSLGAQVLAICNVDFSSIVRESTASILMEAGCEIGVASTKAFTAMILNLYLFKIKMAVRKDLLEASHLQKITQELRSLDALVHQCSALEEQLISIAKE